MSEGGLEDYLKTIVNCENWNNYVFKIRDKENEVLENKYIGLNDLELLKYVCFMKSNTETYSEILHVYNQYDHLLDEIKNGNYK
jgi:hypothetical protein